VTNYSTIGEFSGNGVAAGTTITTTNDTTAGNAVLPTGYDAQYNTSGSPTATYAAPGVNLGGPNPSVARIDCAHPLAPVEIYRFYFKPAAMPTVADSAIVQHRAGGAFAGYLYYRITTGRLSWTDATNGTIANHSPTAGLVAGHVYQIDRVYKHGTGTTDGRSIVRVIDLDSRTWNTDGTFYYDTGDTINAGTIDFDSVRFGKCTSAVAMTAANFTYIAWTTAASIPAQATANTDMSIGTQLFLPPKYGFFEMNGTTEVPLDLQEGNSTTSPVWLFPMFFEA
jgi:hypothetical protein